MEESGRVGGRDADRFLDVSWSGSAMTQLARQLLISHSLTFHEGVAHKNWNVALHKTRNLLIRQHLLWRATFHRRQQVAGRDRYRPQLPPAVARKCPHREVSLFSSKCPHREKAGVLPVTIRPVTPPAVKNRGEGG
jgi:hypothetical protein